MCKTSRTSFLIRCTGEPVTTVGIVSGRNQRELEITNSAYFPAEIVGYDDNPASERERESGTGETDDEDHYYTSIPS